jgi:predicted ABC-type ATPase
MTKLVIIRGIPGSGKSTVAAKIAEMLGCKVWEADQYFMKDGEYQFDPSKLGAAHKACQLNVENDLVCGGSSIVANTNTTMKEMKPYLDMAEKHGADVLVVKCIGNWENVHGVPVQALERMLARWQDYDGEYVYDTTESRAYIKLAGAVLE